MFGKSESSGFKVLFILFAVAIILAALSNALPS